ncbi:hypothetical protein ANCCAN_13180, partial [Ancylostoma caninum]
MSPHSTTAITDNSKQNATSRNTPTRLLTQLSSPQFSEKFIAFNQFQFLSYPHTANNLLVVAVTCLLYLKYAQILLRYSKGVSNTDLSAAQRSFFYTPPYFVYIGHSCWQLTN